MFSAQQMYKIRDLKAGVYGVSGLLRNLLLSVLTTPDKNRPRAVLLSLGARLGSPMLASVLASMGFEVHVFSKRMPGYELAHAEHWHRVDCLNEYDRLLVDVKNLSPIGVFSESRNVLLPVKAKLLNDLGMRGFGELAPVTSSSKIAFRSALDNADVKNMKWGLLSEKSTRGFNFPFVIKPDRGTGSRGVSFIENDDELAAYILDHESRVETLTTGGQMIIEEYINGRQFDVEGISRDGMPYPLTLTEEHYEQVGKRFPSLWYLFSPPINTELRQNLFACAITSIKAVGVINGAWHCEMRADKNGTIYPLDYSNRMGYPRMVSESCGENFLELYVRTLLDADFSAPEPKSGVVFQRFIRTAEEKKKYNQLAKEHPESIIEYRRTKTEVAHVTRHGRISIRAESVPALHSLLSSFRVVPGEWGVYYGLV